MAELRGDAQGPTRRGRAAGRFQGPPAPPDGPAADARHVHCAWCGGESPVGSRLCTNCGRELFPATAGTPTEPVAPSPDIWSAYSSEATEEAPRSPRPLPPPAARTELRSVPAAPTADDPPPPPPLLATAGRPAVTPREPARPSRTPQILGLLAGAALVVAVLGLVLATRSDDGSSGIVSDSPASSAATLPATSTMTGPIGTVAEDDAPDPIASTVPATTSLTTLRTPETAATAVTTLPPVQTESTPAPTAPVTVPATQPPTPVTAARHDTARDRRAVGHPGAGCHRHPDHRCQRARGSVAVRGVEC